MRTTTRTRLSRAALGAGGVAVMLAVWQLVAPIWFSTLSGKPGAVPPPYPVLLRIVSDLGDPVYAQGLSVTAASALAGFALGVLIAVVLGVLVMLVPILETFATQVGVIAACAPATAIAPIVVLLSPAGSRTVSVALAALAVAFPSIIGVLLGLRATSRTQVDLIRALGGSEPTVIRKVRLVSALPAFLAALKVGAPSAFLGAIVGEFFAVGVDTGAGRILVSLQYVGDYVGMWAIAALATVLSAAGYAMIALLSRLLAPWTVHLGSES